MSLRNWFRLFTANKTITRSRRAVSKRSPRCRLAVELLEDRTVPSTTIQGTVFNDANSNGLLDGGEAGLAGWTVFQDVNRNAIVDQGETVTTTNTFGNYLFDTTDNGQTYDFVGLVLQVGSGGNRWLNSTETNAVVIRTTEPNAIRNFGVFSQPPVGVLPDGPETLVNQTTLGQQGQATYQGSSGGPVSISADAAGNYVVAWRTFVLGGTDTISVRVFNANGSARTDEIIVATFANGTVPGVRGDNAMPEVAMAGDGKFMVAWETLDSTLLVNSVYAQAYNANGIAVGGRITVLAGNAKTRGGLGGVAADANGDFVIVYHVETRKGGWPFGTPTVNAQRYTALGAANGSAIKVATPGLVNGLQSVAMDGAGNFVVVWDDSVSNGLSVFAQRFKANGQKSGSTITVMSGIHSNVAMNTSGQFVVAAGGVAQRFNADGTRLGGLVTTAVPMYGTFGQIGMSIDSAGNVIFAWTDARTSTDYPGIGEVWMQRLTAAGTLEAATIVNTTTEGPQFCPGVAATINGSFVVAWQGYGSGDDAGIFSQGYRL